jgi:hypothetical protein
MSAVAGAADGTRRVHAARRRRQCRYESLNLAAHVGDRPEAVAGNRAIVRAGLQLPSEPLWLEQVHGNVIVDADGLGSRHSDAGPPRADGAVTRQAGRVLAVLVADCLPVLLARADGGGVAAVHAGWRGLAAGVIEAAASALAAPAPELVAWLGPAIGPDHFEVGEEVRARFCTDDASATVAFVRNGRQRWHCDLRRLARQRLERLNVQAIHGGEDCSFTQERSYYSYRRDGVTGRIAALIWIEAAAA